MMFRIVLWDVLPCKIIVALMMEAVRTSETSIDNYFTRQYIPEDKSELGYGVGPYWSGHSHRLVVCLVVVQKLLREPVVFRSMNDINFIFYNSSCYFLFVYP
jgi:hypothetical protein